MKLKFIIACILIISSLNGIAQMYNSATSDSILRGKIILKVKPAYKSICFKNSINIEKYNGILKSFNASVSKLFPSAISPKVEKSKWGNKLVDLTTIYEISFSPDIPVYSVLKSLQQLSETEYCQPVYLPKLFYSPNDPAISFQYYLQNIKAFQAWDICKGDSTIIIGVVDTGIENAHDDLISNINYNFNDPINGIDDDHDGFTDNFRGWDLGNNDNNPEWNIGGGANAHGVAVCGLAGARTNNSKGIASAGFKTKILPIKITDSTGALSRAYEGIVYAADHGCSIINCSWGGTTPQPLGQDVINYATYNRNALVIAAAGNMGTSTNDVYYPSAYDNVLCVAATNSSDLKSGESCYGTQVDLCAPGFGIYTTWSNNGYVSGGHGTSLASPIVASAAALVKSWYGDSINVFQLSEILRMTCDKIDTLTGNLPFIGKLGRGRINLYRALADTLPPSVRFIDYKFTCSGNNFIKPGDTVEIAGDFINYLSPTSLLTASISSDNPYIHFIQEDNSLGIINSMQTVNNQMNPFIFWVDEQLGYDQEVIFKILYDDTLYNDFQYFKYTLNPSFADIDTNHIKVTVTSNGKIGYNNLFPIQGNGFNYNNIGTLINEGGLAIAQGTNKVSRCFRNYSNFKLIKGIRQIIPADPADEKWSSEFSDSLAFSSMIGLKIKFDALEWNSLSKSDFVILNYTIYNSNTYAISDLYAGVFCDWDIANSFRNKMEYDSESRMLYSWYTDQTNLFTGLKLLSYENGFHYAFDSTKTVNASGQIIVSDLTNVKLFQALSSNRDAAGTSANGNDVAGLVSYGPLNINANDSIVLSFALLASNSLYNITQSAAEAQLLFDSLYISIPQNIVENNDIEIYPNPSSNILNIHLTSQKMTKSEVKIYNIQGQCVFVKEMISLNQGINNLILSTNLSKGYYILKFLTKENCYLKPLVIQ